MTMKNYQLKVMNESDTIKWLSADAKTINNLRARISKELRIPYKGKVMVYEMLKDSDPRKPNLKYLGDVVEHWDGMYWYSENKGRISVSKINYLGALTLVRRY